MKSFKVPLALGLTLLFWSSAFVGIRLGLASYTPGALALLRFLIASLATGIIFYRLPRKKPMPWRTRFIIALIGVGAIGVYNLCLNIGELTVPAGIASFVIGLMPVLTIVLSVFFLHEKLHYYAWLGIALSFIGLLLMCLPDNGQFSFDRGIILIFIAAIMGALYSIFQKPFLKSFHPVAVTAWVMWGGTFVLLWFLPDLIHDLQKATTLSTLSVLYLGVFPGAIAYVLWTYVLSHYTASKASIYLYTMPILSTILGVIFLQEYPGFWALFGGFLSLAGAYIANRFECYRPAPDEDDGQL